MKTNVFKKVISLSLVVIFSVSISITTAAAAAGKALVFSDVKAGSWYKQFVDIISSKGITTGIGKGKFGPNNNIKVDELLTWMVQANNIKITHKDTDVYWGCPFIRAAKEQGWVKDGEFENYKVPIKRGEIARIIARAMPDEKKPVSLSEYKNMFKDYDEIQPALRDYILEVRAAGIIGGYYDAKYDTKEYKTGYDDPYAGMIFGADKTATRAEASTMIVNYITPSIRKEPSVVIGDKEAYYNGFKTGVEGVNTVLENIDGTPESENIEGDRYIFAFDVRMWKDYSYQPELAEQGYKEAREILLQKIDTKTIDAAIEYAKTKTDCDTKLNYKWLTSADGKYLVSVSSIPWQSEYVTFTVSYNHK